MRGLLNTENRGHPRIIPVILEQGVEIPPLLKKFNPLYLYELNEVFHRLIEDISNAYDPAKAECTVSLQHLKDRLRIPLARLSSAVSEKN